MIIESSIPRRHIIMRLDPGMYQPRQVVLPQDYSIHAYEPGDERAWAKIQQSVNEFSTVEEALDYYRTDWLPFNSPEKLGHAQFFIASSQGELVADAMLRPCALFPDLAVTRLDWVACMPAYQRQGLVRGLLTFLLNRVLERWPEDPIYLPTQPASYAAVRLYWELGFRACRTSAISEEEKPDSDALDIIEPFYPDGFGAVLKSTMVE